LRDPLVSSDNPIGLCEFAEGLLGHRPASLLGTRPPGEVRATGKRGKEVLKESFHLLISLARPRAEEGLTLSVEGAVSHQVANAIAHRKRTAASPGSSPLVDYGNRFPLCQL